MGKEEGSDRTLLTIVGDPGVESRGRQTEKIHPPTTTGQKEPRSGVSQATVLETNTGPLLEV